MIAGAAGTHAYKIQSEKNAMMGVRAGIDLLRDEDDGGAGGLYRTGSFIYMADTVSYTVSIPIPYDTTGQITAISNFKGWITTIKASVQRKFGSDPYYWEIKRSYIVPNTNEANYVYQ